MADENKNNNDFEDFKDFEDSAFDGIELDSDLSAIDEEQIEKALRNIASQMANSDDKDAYMEEKTQGMADEASKEDTAASESQDAPEPSEIPQNPETIEEFKEPEIIETLEKSEISEAPETNSDISSDENKGIQEDLNEISEEEKELPELDKWEELNDSNDIVKKYIVYISKDFIPIIGKLSTDERSAYINDAIQLKLDMQDAKKQAHKKRNLIIHLVIAATILVFLTPVALYLTNKAIIATFDNYKYSQDNFERLYKHRFEKNKAYTRSLQYNKEYEKKLKTQKKDK